MWVVIFSVVFRSGISGKGINDGSLFSSEASSLELVVVMVVWFCTCLVRLLRKNNDDVAAGATAALSKGDETASYFNSLIRSSAFLTSLVVFLS